jgi:hypothetical protein
MNGMTFISMIAQGISLIGIIASIWYARTGHAIVSGVCFLVMSLFVVAWSKLEKKEDFAHK